MNTSPKLSLGPLQFHWGREQMQAFYTDIETSPVDIVYLGETVCSKRREFRHQDWLDVAERMLAAGKEVVFSTLALIEAQSEVGYLRRLCEQDAVRVEANDMSAVQLLAGRLPFVGGPTLNIVNQRALGILIDLGLYRWVAPIELTRSMFDDIRGEVGAEIEYEFLAWGRLALAYSARCYTARAHDVTKDECENCCIEYPDGLPLDTREADEFLVINGIQTMSSRTNCSLLDGDEWCDRADILRISPQAKGTHEIIAAFDAIRRNELSVWDAVELLAGHAPRGLCNGYWHGTAGMATVDHRQFP